MTIAKFKPAGSSTTTTVENKRRKEVFIKLPAYSQTFDISTLLDYPRMRAILEGCPYRIYDADGIVKDQGTMNSNSGTIKTISSTIVRCEIGAGRWDIDEHAYDDEDCMNPREKD
jgi:hypothetical protein